MDKKLSALLEEEDGAVTIDWVVLSAAVIGIGMLFLYPVAFATSSSASNIGESIGNTPVGYGK